MILCFLCVASSWLSHWIGSVGFMREILYDDLKVWPWFLRYVVHMANLLHENIIFCGKLTRLTSL